MAEAGKQKLGRAVELLRKGATLLEEACPKCGGVMIRYKGRRYCVNCDSITTPTVEADFEGVFAEAVGSLRKLVLKKVEQVAGSLKEEVDIERQLQLASLLSRYLELLEKCKALGRS